MSDFRQSFRISKALFPIVISCGNALLFDHVKDFGEIKDNETFHNIK